jgi:hypothetical protein
MAQIVAARPAGQQDTGGQPASSIRTNRLSARRPRIPTTARPRPDSRPWGKTLLTQ